MGCGASGAYAPGPVEEDGLCCNLWCHLVGTNFGWMDVWVLNPEWMETFATWGEVMLARGI
jgi:hypothetical protein